MANPLDEPSAPARVRAAQADHTRLVRGFPQIYSLGLRVSDTDLVKGIGSMAANLFLSDSIRELVGRVQPAVTLVMHPIFTEPLLSYRQNHDAAFSIVTVITDLARPHRIWFYEKVDLYLLPNRAAVGLAIDRDIPADRLLVTGIPVNPNYGKTPQTAGALLHELSLQPDLFTVLVVGSRRVGNLESYLTALNESGLPLQVIVVTGGDDNLYAAAEQMDWQVPLALFNYVETMPDLMHAADCIVTKAGGLVVSESLASGLPMLITQCNPLHEKGNAEYVVLQGAGDMVQTSGELVPVLRRWLANDGALHKERVTNARRLGRPNSSRDIACIVNLLVEGNAPNSEVFTPYRQMD